MQSGATFILVDREIFENVTNGLSFGGEMRELDSVECDSANFRFQISDILNKSHFHEIFR